MTALVLFCPGVMQGVMPDLIRAFARENDIIVKLEHGTAGVLAKRVAEGEPADLIIGTEADLAGLAKEGRIDADTIEAIGSMGVGVAVKLGAPKPDIGNVESFKAAMLSARSIMYGNPAKGGQSGIHIAAVFAELRLDRTIHSKIRLRDAGPAGLKEVADGKIEVGLCQISEILDNVGVEFVGPFPQAIQNAVTYSVAVHSESKTKVAARSLIEFLGSAEARAKFEAAGFTIN